MKILGLDVGSKTIGVAVSDELGIIAQGVTTLKRKGMNHDITQLLKVIEEQSANGLYPYSSYYLRNVKEQTGEYWHNHFSTVGVVGMNEALLNFMGKGNTIKVVFTLWTAFQ